MGLIFSKKNTIKPTPIETKPKPPKIKEIVQYYEYIKETKMIDDIDTILEIINNTDWHTINKDNTKLLTAPTSDALLNN